VPIEGDAGHPRLGEAELFQGTPFTEGGPASSPDGRWLAYQSNESGTYEVDVRPFPGPGGRWQVSTVGGDFPLWSKAGNEFLFQNMDQRVMAVSYSVNGDSFVPGKPRVWSEVRLRNLRTISTYDLAPGGKRIAALLADDATSDQKPSTQLTFMLNFFDEVRRRVPKGK
jgi:eukaryotic-like serine/threonine-protein kinase